MEFIALNHVQFLRIIRIFEFYVLNIFQKSFPFDQFSAFSLLFCHSLPEEPVHSSHKIAINRYIFYHMRDAKEVFRSHHLALGGNSIDAARAGCDCGVCNSGATALPQGKAQTYPCDEP